jgi:hypothetical protein
MPNNDEKKKKGAGISTKPGSKFDQGSKGASGSKKPFDKRGKGGKGGSSPKPFDNGSKPGDNDNFTPDGKPTGEKQDAFWYAKDANAIQDMASFPFLEIVGSEIGSTSDKVPGAVILSIDHTIAATPSGNLGGNYATRAAKAYFNYVTEGFTGGVNFEAADLGMISLAGASLMALMEEGRRAYETLNYYLQHNKYYAKHIVASLGFDYSSMVSNKANFRSEFNIRVDQINALIKIPKGFFIADRWQFIAKNIFVDASDPEYATIMAYKVKNFLMYDATSVRTGSCLRWYPAPTFNFTTFFQTVDALIDALDDDDVREMFGAISRVYSKGEATYHKVESLGIDDSLTLVINDVINAEIHNASWAHPVNAMNPNIIGYVASAQTTSGTDLFDCPIYQDTKGNILCKTYVAKNTYVPYAGGSKDNDVLLDMYEHLVNPANVLDITANVQVSPTDAETVSVTIGSTPYTYALLCARCEIVEDVLMYTCDSADQTQLYSLGKGQGSPMPVNLNLAMFTHLDSHPILCCTNTLSPTFSSDTYFYFGEINKYTVIDRHKIVQLHDKTMFTLLMMPENTRSVTN